MAPVRHVAEPLSVLAKDGVVRAPFVHPSARPTAAERHHLRGSYAQDDEQPIRLAANLRSQPEASEIPYCEYASLSELDKRKVISTLAR